MFLGKHNENYQNFLETGHVYFLSFLQRRHIMNIEQPFENFIISLKISNPWKSVVTESERQHATQKDCVDQNKSVSVSRVHVKYT